MPNESPLYALNAMLLTFDDYYLIRDTSIVNSHELEEFVKSDPNWVHDDALFGWKLPRVELPIPPPPVEEDAGFDPEAHQADHASFRLNF